MGLFRRKKRAFRKVEEQLDALQTELSSLQKDARVIAGNLGKAAEDAIDTAGAMYNGMEKWTTNSARSMRGTVQSQPLTAVLVSLGAGAILGALFLRR